MPPPPLSPNAPPRRRPRSVRSVACGTEAALLLLECGALFAWRGESPLPVRVHLSGTAGGGGGGGGSSVTELRVAQIASGDYHFGLLTSELFSNLFTWGRNSCGERAFSAITCRTRRQF